MFPLLRYFSIASLIAVVVTTALLSVLHVYAERDQLLNIGESNHVALTQLFANSLLPLFRHLEEETRGLTPEAMQNHHMVTAIRPHVIAVMKETRVAKIKLYDLQGRTVFSTDAAQIGKDYSTNPGFVSARQGQPVSELTHRDRFSAFDREIENRDVLSSYAALQLDGTAPIEGVIEVYSDVTEWVNYTNRQALVVAVATILALSLLYGALFFIVRRADNLIRTQYAQLQSSEAELRIAATAFESQTAMLITDANQVIMRINRAFAENTGYQAADIIGKTPVLFKSGRHDDAFYQAMWHSIDHTGGWQGEIWDRRKNGEVYPQWLTIAAVRDRHGQVTHYVSAHVDISERKRAGEQIRNLAFHDQLTGLPNRTLLLDRIGHALNVALRSDRYGALMFIDLDRFKAVNDNLGHDIGDLLLQEVAQRLLNSIRECDTAARWGGDEFVVMVENLDQDIDKARNQVSEIGHKILSELNRPYQLQEHTLANTPSIGIAMFKDRDDHLDALLKRADEAMYQVKSQGRNNLVICV